MASTTEPSVMDTLAGLVRLSLVLLAIPAVALGSLAAMAVLAAGGIFLLIRGPLRQLLAPTRRQASARSWA
ncbi:MAG: hypothetical protein RL722_2829 [Pseudomonadota bacterium]|jgi:hypothetical protein